MMEWGKFENIIWLSALVIIFILAYRTYKWRKRTFEQFADQPLLPKLIPNLSHQKFLLRLILPTIGLFLCIIALMDPLFGEEEIKIQKEGIDIVYALDLSNSMDAQDVAPSRLEMAKKIISESVERLGGDRVGLIVFAADAYVISPLTHDYSAIQTYINGSSTSLISQQGTNFYDVLLKSSELLEGSPNTEKLLVILSDGEDNESSISKAVTLAKEKKINVLTLGLGTPNGGPIPVHMGGFVEYKLDRNGQTVISKLNESSLRTLAQNASQYIYVKNVETTLSQLHQYLNSLEKKVQDSTTGTDKKHVYQVFLALGLLLIFIDTLTNKHKVFKNKKL